MYNSKNLIFTDKFRNQSHHNSINKHNPTNIQNKIIIKFYKHHIFIQIYTSFISITRNIRDRKPPRYIKRNFPLIQRYAHKQRGDKGRRT